MAGRPFPPSWGNPAGISTDPSGNLYIATATTTWCARSTPGRHQHFAGNNAIAGSFSGDGGLAGSAGLNSPFDVFADSSGNVYIADVGNQRIRKVDNLGVISTVAGNGVIGGAGDGGLPTSAELNYPVAVAKDASGKIYIADSENFRVRVFEECP